MNDNPNCDNANEQSKEQGSAVTSPNRAGGANKGDAGASVDVSNPESASARTGSGNFNNSRRCGRSCERDGAQRVTKPRDFRDGAGRSPRAQRTKQDASNGGSPRSAACRTPASLTTMPRSVEAGIAAHRNAKNNFGNHAAQDPQKRSDGRTVRQPFNGEAHLYEVIQVRLSRTQRLVEVNTNNIRLSANTPVLIRFHRNMLMATTVGCRYRRVAEINALPFVVRIATQDDKRIDVENARFEKMAYELASEFAIAQNLQMKVLSTDLSHDHKNVTVNFASDVRVDFREMVAYLAGKLKMRVEMFQLGLRNGTGLICGLGSCGQLLCCGRFLGQFDPVAVRQIRAQGMASNPKRISGVCGRLYCCMSYEYCDYTRDRRNLPKKGKRVLTRWGIGRVSDIDMIREDIVITYDNGEVQRMTPRDYVPVTDEILTDVESGKIEFPIEHARFYLNADPDNACEPKTPTRSVAPATRVPKSPLHTPAKSTITPRPVASPPISKRTIAKNAPRHATDRAMPPTAAEDQQRASDSTPRDRSPKSLRRTAHRNKKNKIGIVPNIPAEPDKTPCTIAPAPVPAPQPRKLSQDRAHIPSPPFERAPRKVKAHSTPRDDVSGNPDRDLTRSGRRQRPKFTDNVPLPPSTPNP